MRTNIVTFLSNQQTVNQTSKNMKVRIARFLFATLFLVVSTVGFSQSPEIFSIPGSQTWTCPDGVTQVRVECWGGGGAGGGGVQDGTGAARGGGGAGGGYARSTVAVVPGTDYTVFVGAGGIGVVPTVDKEAAPSGGDSYFNTPSTINAPGGTGGEGRVVNSTNAQSGVGAIFDATNLVGTITFKGGNGGTATNAMSGSGGSSGGTASDGTDGAAVNTESVVEGGGNGAAGRNNNAVGKPGSAPGGAGAGARANIGSAWVGGNGGDGMVILIPLIEPTVISLPTSASGFNYAIDEGPSSSQEILVSGTLLTGAPGNLTATASSNFEVSIDDVSFGATAQIPYAAAKLDPISIYVRLKSGLSIGNYTGEKISISGGGLVSAYEIALDGNVATAYVWSGGATGAWTEATNWTPNRTTPLSIDQLIFDGVTAVVTAVPSESIGQLLLKNNASVELQADANATITLTGLNNTDLSIPSGSTLTFGGAAYVIKLDLLTGTTGIVGGNLILTGSDSNKGLNHLILVADVDALHFVSGSIMTAGENFTGKAFSATTNDVVVFESGATYIHASGDVPSGGGDNINYAIFNPGSIYKFTGVEGGSNPAAKTFKPSMATKIYGYLIMDAPSQDFTFYTPGLYYNFENDLDIKGTRWTYNSLLDGIGYVRGNVTIRQDGGIYMGNPSDGTRRCHWVFDGTSGTQTVKTEDNGYFTQPAGATLSIIDINNDVVFDADVQIAGVLNIAAGKTLTIASGRTLTNEGVIVANGTLIMNGTCTGAGYVQTLGSGKVTSAVNGDMVFPVGTTTNCPLSFVGNTSNDVVSVAVGSALTYEHNGNTSDLAVNLEWTTNEVVSGGNVGSISLQWAATQEGASFDNTTDVKVGVYSGSASAFDALIDVTVTGSDPYVVTFSCPASLVNKRFVVGNADAFAIITASPSIEIVSGISVYPTNASSKITVETSSDISNYNIYDLTGKLMLSGILKSSREDIDLLSLNKGVYFIQVMNQNNTSVKKFKVVN